MFSILKQRNYAIACKVVSWTSFPIAHLERSYTHNLSHPQIFTFPPPQFFLEFSIDFFLLVFKNNFQS